MTVYLVAQDYGWNNYTDDDITVFASREDAEVFAATLPGRSEDINIWEKEVINESNHR